MSVSTVDTQSEAKWHAIAADIKPEVRLFIDGEYVDAVEGGRFESINPATGEVIAEVAAGTAADVDRAVASVIAVDGVEEAVAVANDSLYGLAAGVWTSNLNTAHRLIRDLEAGVIWVNCFDEGDMTQPFGGMKQSGNAKDKCFESLLEYTDVKSAWIRHG
jgi:gamma-glutamyl-gamma-aminobutyraldehyde dehydrogenase